MTMFDHPTMLRWITRSTASMAVLSMSWLVGCSTSSNARTAEMIEAPPVPRPATRLVVEIETPRAEWKDEKLYLAVYQDPDRFLDRDAWVAGKTVPVTIPVTTVVFDDLPSGPTAISGFIDIVGDSNLTRNFIGLPEEPWGFSNDISIFLSRPTFDEAAVDLKAPQDEVRFAMDTSLDRSDVRRRRALVGEDE